MWNVLLVYTLPGCLAPTSAEVNELHVNFIDLFLHQVLAAGISSLHKVSVLDRP